MRKAYICTQSNPATDYRIHKMMRTLSDSGYDVRIIGRSHPKQKRQSGDKIRIMRLVFWRGPLFYAELNIRLFLRLLFGRYADLVVSIDLDTLGGCLLGAAMRHEKVLFDSHEYFPGVPEIANRPLVRWVWNKIQDVCVHRADICVTVCQSIADIFKKKYNKDFLVVRNVPLADRVLPTKHDDDKRCRPFTILYQGAVNVGRGIEETLVALRDLPDCRLIVVGNGDVMASVRQMAQTEGVSGRVLFMGQKSFAELPHYMMEADAGIVFMRNICPNYYYSLPNRTFDFIQAGLPIIGINFPEIARIVRGEDIGLCIDSLTPDNVRDAIRTMRDDTESRQRWRENMKRIAPTLTWENETLQLSRILQQL